MKRIVVGISGASGTHLACRFVSQLKRYTECEVHVVVTDSGRLTASFEEPQLFEQMLANADCVHSNASLGESIASGTFKTEGMVIIGALIARKLRILWKQSRKSIKILQYLLSGKNT